ncbi:MAG: class I SAM-dependent methyltransferase [Lachnospiraceae bacterium]
MGNKYIDFFNKNSNIEQGLSRIDDYDLFYQFAPMRKNIINWYKYKENSTVLEIGCGCGTLTEFFLEFAKNVTTLEIDDELFAMSKLRFNDIENVDNRCGDFSAIREYEKFDYIVMIGVFEKLGKYFPYLNVNDMEQLYVQYLRIICSHLTENGEIIIGLDNKYGLKFWSGMKDEFSGKEFYGIEGDVSEASLSRFGYKNLMSLFNRIKDIHIDYYYPVPDFRFPTEIYSDEYLPKPGCINKITPSYRENRLMIFDEVRAFENICKDGLFKEFANSYLMICKKK